jgi:FkbM family methyltransferase
LQSGDSSLRARFARFKELWSKWGIRVAVLHSLYKFVRLPPLTIRIRTPHARHPLYCRMGTSDLYVLWQIFRDREFACLDDMPQATTIVDCGANVGYACAYFLSRFPEAQLIAVEPDAGNFAILQKNLKPYGARVTAIQAGIWFRRAGLRVTVPKTVDGIVGWWGLRVEEAVPGTPADVEAITIGEVIAQTGAPRISLLKIDIEGAEEQVFALGDCGWLPLVDNLTIELHGEKRAQAFRKAIEGQNFAVAQCGELTVCRRA